MIMVRQEQKIILDVYNNDGERVSKRELSSAVFNTPLKEGLVHLAVVAQQANSRSVIAKTKSRGEVRGGGRKPWKQKGTGRARHGSIRSPLWRGGGVTFGPRSNRNYSLKINKKAKHKALCMVLSHKAQHGNIILLDFLAMEKPNTKKVITLLGKLPVIMAKKNTEKLAFIAPQGASTVQKSFRNIPFVSVVSVQSLNIVDVLRPKKLIMPIESIDVIEQKYGNQTEPHIKGEKA